MVLMVLTICGTMLAAFARQCGLSAVQAGKAQRELQHRWGSESCSLAMLSKADELLQSAQTSENPICAEMRTNIVLGGVPFRLLLADELAKVNTNFVADRYGDSGLRDSIRRLQTDQRQQMLVNLRPLLKPDISNPSLPTRFASFDQVFESVSPQELTGPAEGPTSSIGRSLTCWGGGQVNLKRADLPVIKEVLGATVSAQQLATLDAYRRSGKPFNIQEALQRMQLPPGVSAQLIPLVRDSSDCYSLWVAVDEPSRTWFRLYVQAQVGAYDRDVQQWSFAW